MQRFRTIAAAVLISLIVGCAAPGRQISVPAAPMPTVDDLRYELGFVSLERREKFLSDPAELQKLVEALYFRNRMTQLAADFGAGEDADLQALMQRDVEYRLGDWVPRRFLTNLEIPDLRPAARAYYDAHPAEFTPKPGLHLQSIFLQATDEQARKRRSVEAGKLLAQLRKGADFGELAEQHSEDEGRYLKGDIGDNIMPGTLPSAIEPAAFALQVVGQLSEVLESPYGFHILKLLGRREAKVLPYEQTEERIVDKLRNEYRDKALRQWTDEVAPASEWTLDRKTLEEMAARLKASESAAAGNGG